MACNAYGRLSSPPRPRRRCGSGVLKSGSPRLKSKTLMPLARNSRALAPAASVADGFTDPANFEIAIISVAFSLEF